MKRIILALIAAMTLCSLVQAKNRTVTENDSLGNKKRVIELRDTTIDGKTVTDTLSIMTYEGSSSDSKSDKGWKRHNGSGWDWDFDLDGKTSETIISVTAIVFIFGLPLLIVFTVFFFNYKNRKAKYRLAEQALSSGQQLPEDFFKNAEKRRYPYQRYQKHLHRHRIIHLPLGHYRELWSRLCRAADHVHRIRTISYLLYARL